jgi:hypothetical protein
VYDGKLPEIGTATDQGRVVLFALPIVLDEVGHVIPAAPFPATLKV